MKLSLLEPAGLFVKQTVYYMKSKKDIREYRATMAEENLHHSGPV